MALRASESRTCLASATSANGTPRTGGSLAIRQFQPLFGVACEATVTIVTGSVVATFTQQGSHDGTNWFDLKPSQNTAAVTMTATGTRTFSVEPAAWCYAFFRCNVTLSGAATAAGDLTQIDYRVVKFGAA